MSALLIHNAKLLSFQPGFQQQQDSLVIEDGLIRAVGQFCEFQSFVQSGIPLMDAKGKTLMPGFNDTHIHIWKVGNLKTFMLDLRQSLSLDHMLSMISDFHHRYPELQWIVARGFNETLWSKPELPTKTDLDRISLAKPIYIIHTSAHTAVANSRAMEMASVNAGSKVPSGGEMQFGADGHPNGIFSETALGMITKYITPYTKAELKTMILTARAELFRLGITAATDPAVDTVLLQAYQELNNDQALGFRLNAIPILLPDGSDIPDPVPSLMDSAFLKLNTVKFFSDGGLSSHTAAIKRPYRNSAGHGILRLEKIQYLQLCREAMEKGLGVATHAIGDAAIDLVVEVYKELNLSFPSNIKRIEHLGLPDNKNLEEMAAGNMAASMQSIFIHELGRNFIKFLDENYLNHCYPVKSALQKGILVALSSDAPVVQNFNPLKGLEAAVTRTDRDGNQIAPDEAITVAQGLKAYTSDAAKISGVTEFGELKQGKFADLILLDKNPLQVANNGLSEIKVEKTFVNGVLVYENV